MSLPPAHTPFKIVVIGPESTGKSTLCEALSQHYHSPWCPEYAREYLSRHGKKYNFEDLLRIAQGQLALEDACLQRLESDTQNFPDQKAAPLLFIDTNMYVMKVWCEFVFGKCHPWIIEQIGRRTYDLYLLCNLDLPWVKDELREYPDLETRQKLYTIYKNLLQHQSVPWKEISGNNEERLHCAIIAIDEQLGLKRKNSVQ